MRIGKSGRRYNDSISWAEIQWAEGVYDEMCRLDFAHKNRKVGDDIGLVYPSISHRVSYKVYRGMVQFKYPGYYPSQLRGVKRGAIAGWSGKSRKRMMNALAQWRIAGDMYFITLTYHQDFGEHFKLWKRDMDVFLKRLRRRFPGVGGIWKLEFQRRGAPHFHLLVCLPHSDAHSVDYFQVMRFVSDAWSEIAHEDSVHGGKYATNVRTIVSRRHAMHYASKYMSKDEGRIVDEETGEVYSRQTGRIWSVFGEFDRGVMLLAETSVGQAEAWREAVLIRLVEMGSKFASTFASMNRALGWSVFGIGIDDHAKSEVLAWRDFMSWAYELELRGD